MLKDKVDQSRAWEAYGHTMASIAGLEHLINVSNFHDKAIKVISDTRNRQAKLYHLIQNATARNFGHSVNIFYESHRELQSEKFRESLDNAVSIRNHLVHKYFSVIWKFLDSEQGLDIIACECNFHREYFEGIESHIRINGNCDFLQFYDQISDAQTIMDNHPIHKFLIGDIATIEDAINAVNY